MIDMGIQHERHTSNLHLTAFPGSLTFSTSLQGTLIDAWGTPNAPAGRPLFNMAISTSLLFSFYCIVPKLIHASCTCYCNLNNLN